MQDCGETAEVHDWTLRRLREMAGRLTEQAYLRASAAAGQDDEAHARWMLVFDRMARGLRLSIALEARLARERGGDAAVRSAGGGQPSPALAGAAGRHDARPCELDREHEDDGLPAATPLAEAVERVRAVVAGADAPASQPVPRLSRAERGALALQRAERAQRAARELPPDEPWDVLTLAERSDYDAPAWPGAG